MKKILFVAHVQSHIVNFHLPFLKCFDENGYEVYVATKLDTKKYEYINKEYPYINWIDIDIPRNPVTTKVFSALKSLMNLMKENEFKLIHVHTPVGGFIGRLAAKLTKSGPVLYTAHGFHFYKGAPLMHWMTYYLSEKVASRWTDGIITINEEDYQLAKKKFESEKCKIYKINGVGVDLSKFDSNLKKDLEFKKELGLEEEDFVITVVAELIKRKNHMQIINAMERISSERSNIKVLFAGDGVLFNELKKQISDRRLENNILMLGFRRDISKIINISDVIGLFSIHEGLPKNILEAMACGKPVICTDIRGNNDLIKDEINGYTVGLHDIEKTYNKIISCVDNQSDLERLKYRTSEIIKKYDINKILMDMSEIYSNMINTNF